jgi:hypothetical protein
MTEKTILRRVIVEKPIQQVTFELMQEGWTLIADNGDRVFLYKGRAVVARAANATNN